MNFDQEHINDLYAAEVVTQDGESLGGVGQVYLDDQTGEPSWVTVKTGWFGANESVVPLQSATFTDGRVAVPYGKDVIKNAPNVDADQHISEQEQDELFRYYGDAGVDVARYQGDREVAGPSTAGTGATGMGPAGMGAAGMGAAGVGPAGMGAAADDRFLEEDRPEASAGPVGLGRDRAGTPEDGSMTLHEERVDVGTERVESGRVRLRKHTVTEHETRTVPVEREVVEVVREPVTEGEAHDRESMGGADEAEVVLHEDRPVIDKDVVATERVGLDKQTVSGQERVAAEVSHEEVDVERDMAAERDTTAGLTDRDLGGDAVDRDLESGVEHPSARGRGDADRRRDV